MSKLKVCHIVNWYPNNENAKETIWTRKHVNALNTKCENHVFHVQVREGKFGYKSTKISDYESSYFFYTKTKIWFIKELITTLLLIYVLIFKMKRKSYDIFNFQITYPLLTYSKLICWLIKKPIVVTEHWSAYHFKFGVTKELKRIKRIFKNKKLHFICVSEALARDIESFSDQKINYFIVPNVIEEKFKKEEIDKPKNSFFMLSYWKSPKNPILVLKVFEKLKKESHKFEIKIGGYGPMIEEMKTAIIKFNLTEEVSMIGELEQNEIINQFNLNSYFIHNSNYEVASVVCTESLCCGTPVIASKVGGIVEYLNESNGVLVADNEFCSWYEAIKLALENSNSFDGNSISKTAGDRFYFSKIAQLYFDTLVAIIDKDSINK